MKPMTQKELATKLGVSVRTVQNWQKRGVVEAVKIGRVVRITKIHAVRLPKEPAEIS